MNSIACKLDLFPYPKLKNFDVFNFSIESHILKKNPLKDSSLKNNPILTPKKKIELNSKFRTQNDPGLVFVLAGFGGNGPKYLADKGFNESFVQQLDRLFSAGECPYAHYVFVDAWTFWGGSQFINSIGTGNYEDYIIYELYPKILELIKVSKLKTAILGHSSGGYGALHLGSKFPKVFPYCGALSPDCFFEGSLLPDLYKAATFLHKNNNYKELRKKHAMRELIDERRGFEVLNAIAMTSCYSPSLEKGRELDWPIDLEKGCLNDKVWARWKQKDPIYFLKQRELKLRQLKGIFLDVGDRDEFQLHFGVRQIHHWMKSQKIRHQYTEFNGGHFDSHSRFPLLYQWLKKLWD